VSGSVLRLLQLASPALPVGAYSYSEGLEGLVHQGAMPIDRPASPGKAKSYERSEETRATVENAQDLEHWLTQELRYGSIRIEAAVMSRSFDATAHQDWESLRDWNDWLTAVRETEELRSQSLQMGRSLLRLFWDIEQSRKAFQPLLHANLLQHLKQEGCNFAVIFGLAAAHWQIGRRDALLGYLQSWATNLMNAGVKLIPIGQTTGQLILFQLQPTLEQAAQDILNLEDDDLNSCGWGLALASMAHETQYSRLFRS
jgi:urease accessory protein